MGGLDVSEYYNSRHQDLLLEAMACAPPMDSANPANCATGASARRVGSCGDSANSASCASGWSAPTLFEQPRLPAFPAEALPAPLRAFVEGEAVATQTPPDLAALLSLSVCAASLAKKIVVELREGYGEPVNLFTVVVMPPGSRKSAVFSDVTRPLADFERTEVERVGPAIAEAQSHHRIAELALKHIESKAASVSGDEQSTLSEEAKRLAHSLEERVVPAVPRYLAADTTPEKLASLLRDHGGKMAVMSPEGGPFELMAGRYSNSPNFEVYLKGHAGDDLRVDRIGRSPEFVRAPALTVALAVQPDVLRSLADQPGFRGRGLLGRFLYALPPTLLGRRQINPPPLSSSARQGYYDLILRLLRLDADVDDVGAEREHVLRLSPRAHCAFDEWSAWIEPQLGELGELSNMTDWGGKLPGAVARLAAILHVVRHSDDLEPWRHLVEQDTMEAAVQIGRYLIPHARAAFASMGADPEVEDAQHLLRWIERTRLACFTKREAFEATKGRFKTVKLLEPPLLVLETNGYIRQRLTEHAGPGRRPSPTYDVNPLGHSHNSHNPQN